VLHQITRVRRLKMCIEFRPEETSLLRTHASQDPYFDSYLGMYGMINKMFTIRIIPIQILEINCVILLNCIIKMSGISSYKDHCHNLYLSVSFTSYITHSTIQYFWNIFLLSMVYFVSRDEKKKDKVGYSRQCVTK